MPWICPNCKRRFKSSNQTHSCIAVDVDSHFINKSPQVVATFLKLLDEVKKFGEVNVNTVKSFIMFKVDSTFCSIKLKKENLVVEFFKNHLEKNKRIIKTLHLSKNRIVHVAVLQKPEDVNSKIISWLKESYQLIRKPE